MPKQTEEELLKMLLGGAPQAQAANNVTSSIGNGVQQPPVQPVAQLPEPQAPASIPTAPQVNMAAMGGPTADERKLRRMIEQQAFDQMQARTQDVGRDRAALQHEASKSGLEKADLSGLAQLAVVAGANPNIAKMYKAPEDETMKLRQQLEKSQEGLSTAQGSFLKNQLEKQNSMMDRSRLMQDRLNEKIYGGVLTNLTKDRDLNELIEKSNNITRIADTAFAPNVPVNTASLHDLQQTVTGALSGLKGGGGVGERAQRYMEDMNTAFAQLRQKYGNDTDTIPRDEPILVHYMDLAHRGQQFLGDQTQKRMEFLAGGHENVTNLPTYREMLNQEKGRLKSTIIQPQYMNTPISNAAMTPSQGGANKANAKSGPMSEADFIQEFLKQKAKANGRQ